MIDSSVFVNTAQAAFTPPAVGIWERANFRPTSACASQWYDYGNNHLTCSISTRRRFLPERPICHRPLAIQCRRPSCTAARLINPITSHETYQRIFAEPRRATRFCHQRPNAFWPSATNWIITSPKCRWNPGSSTGINDRLDDSDLFYFQFGSSRAASSSSRCYRFQYSHYQYDVLMDGDRNDFLQTFGVTLIYSFNKNISLRTFINYSRKQTDDSLHAGISRIRWRHRWRRWTSKFFELTKFSTAAHPIKQASALFCFSSASICENLWQKHFMKPRVRFAPSPTGYLHIGGARTALFNGFTPATPEARLSCAWKTPTPRANRRKP